MKSHIRFQPGSLVSARGREWIVLPDSDAETLWLRPLGASEEDKTLVYCPLELTPVMPAQFPLPTAAEAGPFASGQRLAEALRLKLRSGAGPFRSMGNLALAPRAYQFVPLMMALKQKTVRLLIADDVGIGKTIEAGLIARELYDRGEIRRFTVLCPPHLCEQWHDELKHRFHLQAVIVRSQTAARLERDLPHNQSIFEAYPFTIVSLDYIKSDRRRDEFQRACPECVLVDEAHTCTQSGQGRQQRYMLLEGLAADLARHMIFLTATPHSGNEPAFYSLLGLLRSEFLKLQDPDLAPADRQFWREELAKHFVQRRRQDIQEWQETGMFPQRAQAQISYPLTGQWGHLFNDVLDYARTLVARTEQADVLRQRLSWWAALALLRCISSSPAAAVNALRNRQKQASPDLSDLSDLTEQIMDGIGEALTLNDHDPDICIDDVEILDQLIDRAEALKGPHHDPKLKSLIQQVRALLAEGFLPVIFCRYISTAEYVGEQLRAVLKNYQVTVITGHYPPSERELLIAALHDYDQRILVATDCLSEGMNLQHLFTAVVHYDLSWNPTRHEQREGRVDRFGQAAPEIRTAMLFSEHNPVDQIVLQVILRKAESIRKELGVQVSLLDNEEGALTQAIVGSVLLRQGETRPLTQLGLAFDMPEEKAEIIWRDVYAQAKKNKTIFAQQRLKPEEILTEWHKVNQLLGSEADAAHFVIQTLNQLEQPLEKIQKKNRTCYRLALQGLPPALRARLEAAGLTDGMLIDFYQPPALGAHYIHRTHPLVSILAEDLFEQALQRHSNSSADIFSPRRFQPARTSAIFTKAVKQKTTIVLLRLRHQLSVMQSGQTQILLCEEAHTCAFTGLENGQPMWYDIAEGSTLLLAEPSQNIPPALRTHHISLACAQLATLQPLLDAWCATRKTALLADHRRVREAAQGGGKYDIPEQVIDVMGLFVLIPA